MKAKTFKQFLIEVKYYRQNDVFNNYRHRARFEREAGGFVEINNQLSYVAVTLSNGLEYFFQGEEAENLLDEVPDELSAEDYILAVAQGW